MKFAAPLSEVQNWTSGWFHLWDRFWFTPRSPYMVSVLRITTGMFLLYSHLVLATDLMSFIGPQAWVNPELAQSLHDGRFGESDWGRSYLWYIESSVLLWLHHLLAILVTFAFTIGFCTRITAPITWLIQLVYIHRLTGSLFGLDQIITYMAMYLSIAPCGAYFSVDRRIRGRLGDKLDTSRKLRWLFPDTTPSVAANIATRLLQLHLCVIYLFGGLAKARGQSWWDGTAMWFAVGNYEYQSLDMTWLARYPRVFSLLTHVTLFWEVFYCFLIWPRLLRPLTLFLAFAVHGGIALFMGMTTFGLAMICANAIFIEPAWISRLVCRQSDDEGDEQDAVDSELDDSAEPDLSESDLVETLDATKLQHQADKVRAAGRKVRRRYLALKEREKAVAKRAKELDRRERKLSKRESPGDDPVA